MKKNNKKGFTIVELVIVIAVIAILAAVLIPTFSGVVARANESAALQEAKNSLTQDLVLAEADYDNIKDYVEVSVGTDEDVSEYYTYSEGTYTKATGNAQEGTTYYAKSEYAGTYAENVYTVMTSKGYTCTYNTATGVWTVTKA